MPFSLELNQIHLMFPFARSHCIGPAVADAECRMGIESNEEDITIPIMYTLRTSQHVEE